MATTKKTTGKSKVSVKRLKVKKQKTTEITDKEAKRIRGGQLPASKVKSVIR